MERSRSRLTRRPAWLAAAGLLFVFAGCGLIPAFTARNEPAGEAGSVVRTRASDEIAVADLASSNGVFIGIALSGGGSRAANFSAAVLLELDELGILGNATALSSVSGSSLPNAYYGLFGHDRERWNRERVRQVFRTDLQTAWLWRWLFPPYVLAYWFTDFDRSDIMAGVFDRHLFEKKTFAAMGPQGPRILINATSLTANVKFVFTERSFRRLDSRIDTYPVAHAVMASGAFPGAFHNVTLRNYRTETWAHVFDGGPADNLGVGTLRDIVERLYQAPEKPRGCLLFVVDAYIFEAAKGFADRDTRAFTDFILDKNVMDSAGVMLTLRREEILGEVGIERPAVEAQGQFHPVPGRPEICRTWHLSLQGLLRHALGPRSRDVFQVVNLIDTAYRLQSSRARPRPDAQDLQDHLFEAAHLLVRGDQADLEATCRWLRELGVPGVRC